MTTVISGLKGLNKKFRLIVRALQCIYDPFHFNIYESGAHTVRKPGITAHVDPGKQETSANAGLKLAQRLRSWPNINFLNSNDASKHHFASLKNELISYT